MTKGNAREILTHTLRRFTSVTGQSFGLVFTWRGELSLVGSELFKSFITEHQSEVWKSVACQVHSQERCNPTHEENLLQLVLRGDFICCNVMTLRKSCKNMLVCTNNVYNTTIKATFISHLF